MPQFRVEASKPFETTGVDFAGPIAFKIAKKEQGKCYILLFSCATSRVVHLEFTKTQTAKEFQIKLNLFITRRTRPKVMISDNASVLKSTATWMKNIRKSDTLQDYLARQDINWRFNLSRSPWWGGMYEQLIKDVKKTLHKTLGWTHLTFEQLEAVVIDVENNLAAKVPDIGGIVLIVTDEKNRGVEKGKGCTTYSRKRWSCPRIIVASQGTPH